MQKLIYISIILPSFLLAYERGELIEIIQIIREESVREQNHCKMRKHQWLYYEGRIDACDQILEIVKKPNQLRD